MDQALRAAYEECRNIARSRAKNFYYAFLTLSSSKRQAIYAAYAFFRDCDDIADEDAPLNEKIMRLQEMRQVVARCYAGEPDTPCQYALSDAVHRYNISRAYLEDVIDGVEMDLTIARYRTFEHLREYCYKVASAVGLVCLEVFGYSDPVARDHARDLGLAMQLTNVIRDVKEDLERGRIYIPQEDMERFGYGEDALSRGVVDEAFVRLMRFQAQRAREHFVRGSRLIPFLSLRARGCPAALGGIYQEVLRRIEARGYNVFDGRVELPTATKLAIALRAWVGSWLVRAPAGEKL